MNRWKLLTPEGPDPDIAELHHERSLARNPVDLESDETLGVRPKNIFARDIVNQMSIDPRAHAWSFCDNTQLIPVLISIESVTFFDRLFGRQPSRS